MSLSPDRLEPRAYRDIVLRALEEDLGSALGAGRDVTTDVTVPAITRARGVFIAKADCVVAGLDVAPAAQDRVQHAGRLRGRFEDHRPRTIAK